MKNEWSKWETFFIYDRPIKYKSLEIFPALMKDYIPFFYFGECLTIDKNSIPDVKIIGMSYLEYLYSTHSTETPYVAYLDAILKIVTRKENLDVKYGRNEKGKPVLLIENVEYSSLDFEEIRKIIAEYNGLELPNEKVQKEIRDAYKKAKELRTRNSKMGTLEDQMICVLISTNLSLDEIYNLPIRKFIKILERVDKKLHYQIYLSASLSGFVEFKDKDFIQHWMAQEKDENYGLIPLENVQGTLSGKNYKVRNK